MPFTFEFLGTIFCRLQSQ